MRTFSVLLEMHEWLLTCLGFGGCWSLKDMSHRTTGTELAEIYQDCWVAWHYRLVVLTVVWKIEESLLFLWKIGIDLGRPIGAIAESIDAATRTADLLRTHQWEVVLVCAGERLAL